MTITIMIIIVITFIIVTMIITNNNRSRTIGITSTVVVDIVGIVDVLINVIVLPVLGMRIVILADKDGSTTCLSCSPGRQTPPGRPYTAS